MLQKFNSAMSIDEKTVLRLLVMCNKILGVIWHFY